MRRLTLEGLRRERGFGCFALGSELGEFDVGRGDECVDLLYLFLESLESF